MPPIIDSDNRLSPGRHQTIICISYGIYLVGPLGTYFNETWWRQQMETFSALLAICAGNSPIAGEFPSQRRVTRSFDVFFDLRLNKWLSKQSRGWCIGPPSRSLWRHCNISIKIRQFSFKKIHMKMSSIKFRPFCLGLNAIYASSRRGKVVKANKTK